MLVGAGVSRFDYGALREPTFYAHGEELPRLLEIRDELPNTAVGKLSRRALRDEIQA